MKKKKLTLQFQGKQLGSWWMMSCVGMPEECNTLRQLRCPQWAPQMLGQKSEPVHLGLVRRLPRRRGPRCDQSISASLTVADSSSTQWPPNENMRSVWSSKLSSPQMTWSQVKRTQSPFALVLITNAVPDPTIASLPLFLATITVKTSGLTSFAIAKTAGSGVVFMMLHTNL